MKKNDNNKFDFNLLRNIMIFTIVIIAYNAVYYFKNNRIDIEVTLEIFGAFIIFTLFNYIYVKIRDAK